MPCDNKTKQMRGELHHGAFKPGGCRKLHRAAFGGGDVCVCGGGVKAGDESDGCPSVKYVQIPPSSRSLLARQRE